MEKESQIPFGDYFSVDPFASSDASMVETVQKEEPSEHKPVLPNGPRADEAELRTYLKALRHFFADGVKTTLGLTRPVAPVLLAPFIRGQHPDSDYPVFYHPEDHSLHPLRTLLQDKYQDLFSEGEEKILKPNLLRLEGYMRQILTGKNPGDYKNVVQEAFTKLKDLEVHGEEGKQFLKDCGQLEEAMLKSEGVLIEYASAIPFRLLNLELRHRLNATRELTERIRKLTSGLTELLRLHHNVPADKETIDTGQHDLISGLVSFETVEKMMPADATTGWSPERIQRISDALATLEHAAEFFKDHRSMVFVTAELAREFSLDGILQEATLDITTGHPCAKAEAYFRSEMNDLVGIIAAMRMAELELSNEYDEDLHNRYFERFGFVNLREEDVQLLPGLLVIAESRQLLQEPEDFLALVTDNAPIKVLAINRVGELRLPEEDEDLSLFRQELASLALSHRNAYIFQGSSDLPGLLNQALQAGLNSPLPVLWNVLFADKASKDSMYDYVTLNTACESRVFPRLVYDIRAGEQFGSRFSIQANPQADRHFASTSLEVLSAGQTENKEFTLTMADFYAMDPARSGELEIIPPSHYPDNLLPLEDYLTMSSGAIESQLPFIWVLDEKDELHKAVIPFSWLAPCKERLDNWQFIQELAGVNSYHVNRAIEKARNDWETAKIKEMEALKAEMESEIARVRQEEGGKAMDRLVNVLLDLDQVVPAPSSSITQPKAQSPVEQGEEPTLVQKESPPQEEEAEVSAEAWIETFRCTTCNDCINAVPGVFKYNGDKQAYVHNPQGGTFALIVAAAEKCPARCIHPGLPQNPAEPNLEALIKRAEKFN